MKKFLLLAIVSLMTFAAPYAADYYTVADFIKVYEGLNLSSGSTSEDSYTIRGYVTKWKNGYPTYQNGDFFIDDSADGSTTLLECFRLTAENEEDKRELSKGDYVEATAKVQNYSGRAELVSGTYRVLDGEAWEPIPVSISDFIGLNDGKRYILTGVVSNISDTVYGHFDLTDETASAYVYGLANAEGKTKQFASLGIKEGDTLTLSGIYELYKEKHEVTSGQYISHIPAAEQPVEPGEIYVDFVSQMYDWSSWVGKTVTFTNNFYLLSTGSNTVAYTRLRSPEEYGDNDTELYNTAVTHNTWATCSLDGVSMNGRRGGTVIHGLKAKVTSANNLQAISYDSIVNHDLPTVRPDLGNPDLVICGANVENFFVDHLGEGSEYLGAANAEQLEVQKKKISSALYNIDADIYALCEVEEGPNAVGALVDALNNKAGVTRYAWVNNGFNSYNSTMVCYIYRTDKVKPVGSYIKPYSGTGGTYLYREAIQCFQELASGEKFNLSMNHFKAKVNGENDELRKENMTKLIDAFPQALNNDPDILVMGDLNAYSGEESNMLLTRDKGFTDLLNLYEPDDYSYVYGGLVGYLDHAYANSSMAGQVTKAVPYHLNADTWKSYEYSNGDETMYRYADHDPILVGLKLGNGSTPVDPEPEKYDTITVKLDPASVANFEWPAVGIWAWNEDGDIFSSWPGELVGTDENGWYSYTFEGVKTPISILWNNHQNGSTSRQTGDITGITENTCYQLTYDDSNYVIAVECPEPAQPSKVLTVAKAIELGNALADNATSEDTVTVEGYVINPGNFSFLNMNQSWYMADEASSTSKEFQAYGCTPVINWEYARVFAGDKVRLTGQIKKYVKNSTTTIEIVNGYASFVEMVDGDHSISLEVQDVSIAEAVTIGNSLASGSATNKPYRITGYVSALDKDFDSNYKNQSFWIADDKSSTASSSADGAFYIYRGKPSTEAAVNVGDRVQIVDAIKKFNSTIENNDQNITVTVLPEEEPIEYDTITVKLYKGALNWESVYLYAWTTNNEGKTIDEPAGTWPGDKAIESQTSWYSYTFAVQKGGTHHIIWNNGGNYHQSVDIDITESTCYYLETGYYQDENFYYYVNTLDCPEPVEPEPEKYDTITVKLDPSVGWSNVGIWAWDKNGANLFDEWPGAYVEKDPETGWWSYTFEGVQAPIGIVWNNFNNGQQSVDIHDISENTCFSLSYSYEDDGKAYYMYTIVACPEPQEPEPSKPWEPITVQLNPNSVVDNGWHFVYLYAWATDKNGTSLGVVFSNYLERNEETGWYDHTFTDSIPGHLNIFWADYDGYFGIRHRTRNITNVDESTCFRITGTDDSNYSLYEIADCSEIQPLPTPECYYQLIMKDQYSDGWNGGALAIKDGDVAMLYTLGSESPTITKLVPYYGNEVTFSWLSGKWDEEVGFTIAATNGVGIFHHEMGSELKEGLVYTMTESPCQSGYNPYIPQNITALLNDDNTMTVSWDPVKGAAFYRITIASPAGGYNLYSEQRVDGEEFTTGALDYNGDHTIIVTSCDVEGTPIGEASITYNVNMPLVEEATIEVLVPSDCSMDVSNGLWLLWQSPEGYTYTPMTTEDGHLYSLTIKPMLPTYYFDVYNTYGYTDSTQSAWGMQTREKHYCGEMDIRYDEDNKRYSLIRVSDCNLVDHDYRVSNLKAVSSPGRIDFSWDAKDVAYQYYLYMYNVNDTAMSNAQFAYGTNTNSLTIYLEDYYAGNEYNWTVAAVHPRSGNWFEAVKADESVTIQKREVEISNAIVTTEDSVTAKMSWECNTDTVDYLVQIYLGSYIVKQTIISTTSFEYTAIAPKYHYFYVTPVSKQTKQQLAATTSFGYLYLSKAEEAFTEIEGNASGRHITYTWKQNANVEQAIAQVFRAIENDYEYLYADTVANARLEYDAEEDGLYLLQLYPYVEFEEGMFTRVSVPYHTAAQVFTGKTYHVEFTATEGGYVWPEGLSGNYPEGYVFSDLRATPNTGYRFVKWSDGVMERYRSYTVTGDATLEAIFELIPVYTVHVDAAENGRIYVSGYKAPYEGTYQEGSSVWVETYPDDGYYFEKWSDGVETNGRYIYVTQDTVLTAIFRPYCTVILNECTNGYIEISGNYESSEGNVYTFRYGTEVTLTAKPEENYQLTRWNDGVTTIQRTFAITEHMTFEAYFEWAGEKARYAVDIDVEGTGYGQISDYDSEYYEGSVITITATPAEGSIFEGWSDGEMANPRDVVINKDIYFNAIFTLKQFTLNVSSNGNGSVDPSGSSIRNYGEHVEISATPDPGYRFVKWSDENTSDVRKVYIMQDTSLIAYFEEVPTYQLQVKVAGKGQIKVNDSDWSTLIQRRFEENESVTISAQSVDNSVFLGWSDGVVKQQRTIKITSDTAIVAQFQSTEEHTLTLKAETGGKIKATGMADFGTSFKQSFDLSAPVDIEAKADEGYIFYEWKEDGNKQASRSPYITQDTTLTATFLAKHILTVENSAGGSVIVSGYLEKANDAYTFVHGKTATLIAYAEDNYRFVQWEDGTKELKREITITSDLTVRATFEYVGEKIERQVTIGVQGEGGTISGYDPNQKYYQGDEFDVEAVAAAGFEFAYWTDDYSTTNPRHVEVGNNDIAFNALFIKSTKKFKLTLKASDGGIILLEGDTAKETPYEFVENTKVTLEAKASEHYHFLKWTDDANASASREIILTQDTVLTAAFEGDLYKITFKNFNDTVLEEKEWSYGSMPRCSVTPTRTAEGNKEFEFDKWDPAITKVTGEATYKAVFKEKAAYYTVTFYRDNKFTVVIDEQKVKPGQAAEIPETPKRTGYDFVAWVVDEGDLDELENVQRDLDVYGTWKKAEEGLEDIIRGTEATKIYLNGQIYIVRGDKVYTLQGQEVTTSK